MSENLVQYIITEILRKKYRIVVNEVPVLSRCIDIVFINEHNEIVSIEIKLKDWRKGISQAKDHQLVADKSYIYLPKKKNGVSEKLNMYLKDTGIGLCLFNPTKRSGRLKIEEVKTAEKNKFTWGSSRKKLEDIIYAESN